MKMAPVLRELSRYRDIESVLVHTGQHYDETMSGVFFQQLGMPKPDFNLNVGSASHAVQTAQTMMRFEEVCNKVKPDLVVVAGDVNSTLACSLAATKLQIPVAHIESGLRSFDRTMPEEINRIVTDSISDHLFTTEESGNRNLRCEGVGEEKIHFVGNTMIDSLVRYRGLLHQGTRVGAPDRLNDEPYFLATIHRPSNVDDPAQLAQVLRILESASRLAAVFFVTHPRTLERLKRLEEGANLVQLDEAAQKIERRFVYVLPPLAYLDFLRLMAASSAVLTDSGGVQEETTFLGIPCLTLRSNTERPVTVELGTNELVGLDEGKILSHLASIAARKWKRASKPSLWDGHAAGRIVSVLRQKFGLPASSAEMGAVNG
jgi:UDP-N-acetylglucosamine 2-epimerase (non-hydrolysing)